MALITNFRAMFTNSHKHSTYSLLVLKLHQTWPIIAFIFEFVLSLAVVFYSASFKGICHRTDHIPLRHIGRILILASKARCLVNQRHLCSCMNTLQAHDDFDFTKDSQLPRRATCGVLAVLVEGDLLVRLFVILAPFFPPLLCFSLNSSRPS